jgi:hypothetical protein
MVSLSNHEVYFPTKVSFPRKREPPFYGLKEEKQRSPLSRG